MIHIYIHTHKHNLITKKQFSTQYVHSICTHGLVDVSGGALAEQVGDTIVFVHSSVGSPAKFGLRGSPSSGLFIMVYYCRHYYCCRTYDGHDCQFSIFFSARITHGWPAPNVGNVILDTTRAVHTRSIMSSLVCTAHNFIGRSEPAAGPGEASPPRLIRPIKTRPPPVTRCVPFLVPLTSVIMMGVDGTRPVISGVREC